MDEFIESILNSKKIYKKSYILDKYESINKFLCDFLDYIYIRTNTRKWFNDLEVSNIGKYIEKYNDYDNKVLEKMKMIRDRILQLIGCSNKSNSNRLKNISNYFSEILEINNCNLKNIQEEKNELGKTIDMLIFENNNLGIINVISKSQKLFKYRYPDGETISNKTLRYLKESLNKDNIEQADYYSRVLFELLKNDYNKIDKILTELREYKIEVNSKEKCKLLLALIDKLTIIKYSSISVIEKNNYIKNFKHDYNIHSDFPKLIETKEELCNSRINHVIDMRDRNVITIDHKFKTAYDDAISIQKTSNGYLFSIYIADVASFIDLNSMLHRCAKQSCESIYGDVKNSFYIPMFPLDITRNLFSLDKDIDRYAIAYDFEFSDNYDFIGYKFNNAKIRINNNYTFDSVEHINNNDPNYDMINALIKITEKLNNNSTYHSFKEKNKIHTKDNSVGSNIISIATIYLNSFIANYFNTCNYPYIYKIHESLDCNTKCKDAQELINKCSISRYSAYPKGHPVNNGKPYGQITNPIRSYVSFINQYIFEYLMLDMNRKEDVIKFKNYWHENLPYIVDDINKRIEKNKEFLSIIHELESKRLTKKK